MKGSHKDVPIAGVRGNLSLRYYLSGKDFVKDLFIKEDLISAEVGGLTLQSGVLSLYTLEFRQWEPVEVHADFTFYGDLGGTFTPAPDLTEIENVLNFSDASINGTGIGAPEKLLSASFEYSAEHKALYEDGDIVPKSIIQETRKQASSVETYTITGEAPVEGDDAAVEITLRDEDSNVIDSYLVEGKVLGLSTRYDAGEQILSSFNIDQRRVGKEPIIDTLTPANGAPGTSVVIGGSNFDLTTDVFFFETRADEFTLNSSASITVIVPEFAIDGPVRVFAIGGEGVSSTDFNVEGDIGVG